MAAGIGTVIQLIIVLAVFGGIGYAIVKASEATDAAVKSTKEKLEARGVNLSSKGAAIKTDRRAYTAEETADQLQRGIMQGWKHSKFDVGGALAYTTRLAGSSHDKNKAEYEKIHGPKQKKSQ
ncbi:hypothetical protein MNV49_002776 [Pseudohyphozyma bogoriensis]|nr:hypothetical protein MNV49_002776 [Pseudohyphozyma bogoriensis]